MKDIIINHSMNLIHSLNKYNEDELEQIKYGLESVYLLLTKFIFIIGISIILGIFKETLLFIIFFNILRSTAFGIHASKSIYCWISSVICFLILPYLSRIIILPNLVFISVTIICTMLFIIYAPADTKNRPLINSQKRKKFKIITVISSLILTIVIFTIKINVVKNLIIFSMILQVILILPITYQIFKLPYNNYKKYR